MKYLLLIVFFLFSSCYTQFLNPYAPVSKWAEHKRNEITNYDLFLSNPYGIIDMKYHDRIDLDQEWGVYFDRWSFVSFPSYESNHDDLGTNQKIVHSVSYYNQYISGAAIYNSGMKESKTAVSTHTSAPSFKSQPVNTSSAVSGYHSSSSKRANTSSGNNSKVTVKSNGKSYKSKPEKNSSSNSVKKKKK